MGICSPQVPHLHNTTVGVVIVGVVSELTYPSLAPADISLLS